MMPRHSLRLTVVCSAVLFAWNVQAQQSETPAATDASGAPLKAAKAAAPAMQMPVTAPTAPMTAAANNFFLIRFKTILSSKQMKS